jgi:hypothetical protein
MPLWQAAARALGAVAGFGETATGFAKGGASCADAPNESAREAATVAIAVRIAGQGIVFTIS